MKSLVLPALLLLLTLALPTAVPSPPLAAAPRTLYVATTGDDANPGTIARPLRTVQRGLDLAIPGDTVLVRGGRYREYVEFRRSGLPGAPISLLGYPGEAVTLYGAGLEWRYAVNLEGYDHLRVGRLRIDDYIREGTRGFGVVGWGDTDDVTLFDFRISRVSTPIKFGGADVPGVSTGLRIRNVVARRYDGGGIDLGPGPVAGVSIRRVRLYGPGEGNDTAVDGIAVEDGRRVTIVDAMVTGHPGDGIDLKATGVRVVRSRVLGTARDGLKLWHDARVENTLVVGAGLTALVIEAPGPFDIRNSLFASGPGHGYTVTAGPDEGDGASQVAFWNTIFASPENTGTLIYVSATTTLSGDNNLYWAPRRRDDVICDRGGSRCFSGDDINGDRWSNASGMDADSAFADPRFIDPAAGDYHLAPGSPAIDAADDPHAPAVDLDGHPRPAGPHADIGPYEWSPAR